MSFLLFGYVFVIYYILYEIVVIFRNVQYTLAFSYNQLFKLFFKHVFNFWLTFQTFLQTNQVLLYYRFQIVTIEFGFSLFFSCKPSNYSNCNFPSGTSSHFQLFFMCRKGKKQSCRRLFGYYKCTALPWMPIKLVLNLKCVNEVTLK